MDNLKVDTDINQKEMYDQEKHNPCLKKLTELKTEVNSKTPTSIPKKRGRKKKGEQNHSQESFVETFDELKSRRGRKRKSVNYFALANPDVEDELNFISRKSDKSVNIVPNLKDDRLSAKKINSLKNGEIAKKKCVPVDLGLETLQSTSSQDFSSNSSNLNSQTLDEPKTEVKTEGDTLILKSVGLKRGVDNEEEIMANDSNNDNCLEDMSTDLHKEKLYRKTGNTTQMLNTLFSQVDFQEVIVDGVQHPIIKKAKSPAKRGRSAGKGKNKTVKNEIADTEELELKTLKTTVTCAVCKNEMDKNNWPYHKQRYHNNLAWRIGEPPLDLTNMDLVKQILNSLYLARKLFYCDKCDKAMKSVNGFLSHKSVCGKTVEAVRVPCQYCSRKMLPVSLPSHIRHHHEAIEGVEPKVKKKSNLSIAVANAKRKAAAKALKVIQHFNLEYSGIRSTFTKYFEDLSFISSDISTTMLQKQIIASKRVACKYPNCNFECVSAEDIKQHLKFCVNRPENGYVCKHCLFVQLTIADIIYHIETVHGVIIKEGEDSDSEPVENPPKAKVEKPKRGSRKKLTIEKEKSLPKKTPYFLPTEKKLDQIFEKAYEWTLDFCEKNFCCPIPEENFPCLKANWDLMPVDTIQEYLPLMGYSCDVGFETVVDFQDVLHKDHTFRKFNLFESYLENNGNSTIFCGGPINSISWLPTPHTKNSVHQIVAVSTKKHPDSKYTNDANYNEKCLIQFWDVGPLKNLDTSMCRPRLGFCLSFDHGPVWDMQWCPSNCYDLDEPTEASDKFRRMGILAVAGSDSAIYIYSIPNFKASGLIYNSRPVMILNPMAVQEATFGNRKFYASRISWSKAPGHKYLAAGYTNGMVAIFYLSSTSEVLRKNDSNIDTLIPYKTFQAHYHHISTITLHHLNDGCRWLLTGSYDRAVSLWDLNETSAPVQTIKRNIVNDAIWMTNWLCHVIAYDEASTIGQASSIMQQTRDFLSDPLYLFHCSAAITSITGSDWLNGIIQANAVGEIFATFPKQIMMNLNWKYLKNKKLLFGYTTLVEKRKTVEERLRENSEKEMALRNQLTVKTVLKSGELPSNKEVTHLDYNPHYYEYEPLLYHEVDNKYGLIFCDHKMNCISDFPQSLRENMSFSSKMYASSKPNIYPLQAINRIQMNPNRQATTYYVTGYQAGFVRLTSMKFLNKDPQVIADSIELNE
ncbi:hypothetical protein WA026_000622 [Henosepilachna vigintioctopunctata]|uniref:General transcription factor 3C polypeptide 2 n=1 Tax=Henosepilachna vigintioctopunctata TaxID=420089 RepID=A0AAW1V5I6_9CUCU